MPVKAHDQAQATSTPTTGWLRTYPVEPYSAYWHLSLTVRNFDKALRKAIEALKNGKAEPLVPIEQEVGSKKNGYQQLSYRVPVDRIDKVVKSLQKLGTGEPTVRAAMIDPAVFDEAKERLSKLDVEAADNKDALAKMPATGAAVTEIRQNLANAVRVHEQAKTRILINIELRQSPPLK